MSMATHISICCDTKGCNATYSEVDSSEYEVKAEARRRGWITKIVDYCPDCRAKQEASE